MSDRLKQAHDRFTEIKLDLGLRDIPEDGGARLDAVVRWLDSAADDATVPLRATQVLLLDSEVPSAAKRPVVKNAYKALGGGWLSAGAEALHLLQAMVLAARPEVGARGFGLVGLMGAGWEVMVGRELMREAVRPWRGLRAGAVGERHEFNVGATAELGPTTSAMTTPDDAARVAALAALEELRENFQAGWVYFKQYSDKLLRILGYVNDTVERIVAQHNAQTNRMRGLAPNLQYLRDSKDTRGQYNGYSEHLILWIGGITQVLSERGIALPGLSQGWNMLRVHRGQTWNFEQLSPHLLPVLDALMYAVGQLQDRERLSSTVHTVSVALQQHSSQIRATLSTLSTQLPAALAAAHPPELELLWWGQARYCHTYGAPYRSLLKSPDNRTPALYAAIAEAADRAWRLDPEPSAAYLVEVLAGFHFNVDTTRPIAAWMRELSTHLPSADAPQGPLGSLAAEDAIGLPVTWARQHPRFAEDDVQLANLLGMPVETEIDLGTWATWILRERVLERRLRA